MKQPYLIVTNPISAKCQYWFILDDYYSKDEYYAIRDNMLESLE
jgi:hypothetical protein